jgi:hypothetical protein
MNSHKVLDLNGSIGPPSGQQADNRLSESFAAYNNVMSGAADQSNFKDSFKNPWTTIPRPMNRFIEIS